MLPTYDICRRSFIHAMALLRYLPKKVSSLTEKEVKEVNAGIAQAQEEAETVASGRGKYNAYTAQERARIGKYAAEHGPAKAVRHCSKLLGRPVPETTARRLRSVYLQELKTMVCKCADDHAPVVDYLPTKAQGRPLFLGSELDRSIQDYITALRRVGGVVNMSIVVAAAKGLLGARKPELVLTEHGGHIEITRGWAKSLLSRMGYVKRKGCNAGKVSVSRFEEIQEVFLADIQAEVVMNDIPQDLVFNRDQTGIELVPTGQWTMNRAKEKVIPIAHSDDKRQITAVLAVTLAGEYLSLNDNIFIIYTQVNMVQ